MASLGFIKIKGNVSIISLTALLGLLYALLALGDKTDSPASELQSSARTAFSLVDHNGNSVSEKDYRGKYMLIFFGYTYCPDVCPVDLKIITDALKFVGKQGQEIVPIFISVDPERDKPKILTEYVRFFSPRLVGLSGTRSQVNAAVKGFGARYFKVFMPPVPGSEAKSNEDDVDENMNYLVKHSASTYFVGPDGLLLTTFPHNTNAIEMGTTIQEFLSNN